MLNSSPRMLLAFALVAGSTPTLLFGQSLPEAEQVEFFELNIRPVLVEQCYSCHSSDADEIEGGLSLDTREGIRRGGDTGPAVVPRSVDRSLLIKAIRQVDDNLQMPPDRKLPAEVIADFEKWISRGAADPRDGAATVEHPYEIDIEAGRQFWAFQPPQRAAPPEVEDTDWPWTDIDRFLLARMEQEGLHPVADSDAESLVRRLYYDLIGLPPAPEDVGRFVEMHAGDSRAAVEYVVDQLLDSPRFGERWGRHWLDVARYAESTGQATNFAYPHAWRYRDWVIDAFNADKPYDDFLREQLAGDLLRAADFDERAANLVATGFLAIGPKALSERSRRQFQADVVDEQIDATFQAFQALTVACARCHDHRFDPVPQTDYYALAGIFRSTETCYGTIRVVQSNHPSDLLELPSGAEVVQSLGPLTSSRRERIEGQIDDLREQMEGMTSRDDFIRRIFTGARVTELRSELDSYDADGDPIAVAMGVRESRFAGDSPLYVRGEIDQPAERVRRGFPQVLAETQPRIGFRSSGRRELADWMASSENPLTARVMANRVWLHLMGRGIVATPDNFGASGQRPSHPELLDSLALRFIDEDWSVKRLIHEIVISRAYQLSSEFNQENYDVDPDNVLVWHMPKQRLEAEAIRDTLLQLSGRLDLSPPVGSQVALGGEGNIGFLFRGDPAETDAHRSVYLPIVRDQLPEMLTIFDFPDPSLIIGQRSSTTIPAQSLFLMNNTFVIQQAEEMARRLIDEFENEEERVRQAYRLCYSREPTEPEVSRALAFIDDYSRIHLPRATWTAFCQAVFASAEFTQK